MLSLRKRFFTFEKKYIQKKRLLELYKIKKFSIKRISFILDVGVSTVHRKLHRYNIKVRPVGKERIDITFPKLRLSKEKGLSIKEIAQRFNCIPSTIRKRMNECGIKYRIKGKSITHYNKKNFSRNLLEAAYLTGFRLGDLGVEVKDKLIRIKSSTTKKEQVELLKKLFGKYTFVRIGKKDKYGATMFDCYLNNSFDFLVKKEDRIPDWVYGNSDRLFSFVAGYVDAEGSFGINQGRARFNIDSCDKGILSQIHDWLNKNSISNKFFCILKKGNLISGYPLRKDLWRINVNEALSLLRFIDKISPYIKHSKREKDMEKAKNNILFRQKRQTIKQCSIYATSL